MIIIVLWITWLKDNLYLFGEIFDPISSSVIWVNFKMKSGCDSSKENVDCLKRAFYPYAPINLILSFKNFNILSIVSTLTMTWILTMTENLLS